MQGDSRSAVIKSIFKDITNLQDVIEETKTVQTEYEKEDEDINKEALDGYITSTKKIVTSLKDSVDKIHNYFDENFKDWPANEIKNEFVSEVGKIKLVDLSKLIDPNRTMNMQVTSPETNDAIVILSDSGSDELNPPAKRRSRRNSVNNNLYEPEEKSVRRNNRSILKSRPGVDSSFDGSFGNKESTPDRVTKKVQFSNNDTVILSRITSKSSSSSSESEDEVIRAPVKRSARPRARGNIVSESEDDDDDDYEVPDDDGDLQLDKKFSWKCTVKLPRISAEKLKSNYMKKFEDKELKRLTSWKSLKRSHSKKSDSSSDTSDSVTNPKKKNRTGGSRKSGRKSSSSGDSDSNNSSSDGSTKKSSTPEVDVPPPSMNAEENTDEIILGTIQDPGQNNGATATEKNNVNGEETGDSEEVDKNKEAVDNDKESSEKEKDDVPPESTKDQEVDKAGTEPVEQAGEKNSETEKESTQENSSDIEKNSEKQAGNKEQNSDATRKNQESPKPDDSTDTTTTVNDKEEDEPKNAAEEEEKKIAEESDKSRKSSDEDSSDHDKHKKKLVGNSKGDRIKKKKHASDSDDTSDSDSQKKAKSKVDSSDESDDNKKKKSSKDDDSDSRKKEKAKSKVNSSDESEDNKKKKSSNDVSDSDGSNDEEKEKSKWKQNKLLTSQLLDSDEEFEAFKKKKEKLKAKEAESDSDHSPKPKSKKKKSIRKRAKRVLSDSDSENYKKGGSSSSESSESDNKKSSSDSEEDKKKQNEKKKSRKRIKRVKSSSDEDGDKSTRKQIRKVLTKDSLAETTIQAEKDEAARKARITERQKKYNNIFEEEKLEKTTLDKVVLDFNEETREELLVVDKSIVKSLKPHQGKGVQFMWDACFESIDRAKSTDGSGCILAHCMGLGKTLQVVTLVHTLLKNQDKTGVEKVLVVCPLSTVLNWVAEFKKWLPDDECVEVFDLVAYKQNRERIYQTMEWHKHGGVLVLGYDMFRNLTNENNKRLPKKLRSDFKTALVDPGPDLVVCDEGHLLKNEKTSLSMSMNKLKTARRIVLTGTPLQNNLKEYWCMVQFVKPNLLGTYKEYLNRFVNPIVNGQYTDSTPHDIQIMRKRSHVLHKLLDGVVQRRDYSVLAPFLPPKCEYVVFIKLTDTQVKLYTHYMKEFARKPSPGGGKSFIFVDFQELQRICTHPRVLLDKSIQNRIAQEKKDWENDDESEGSLKEFIDDGSDAESTPNESSSGGSSNESDDKKKEKASSNKYKRRTRAMAEQNPESEEEEEVVRADPSEWWRQYTPGDELDNIIHSGKLHLLFEILQQCEVIGDKVLVFSQSLYSLNVIEYFLSKIDEGTQNKDSSLVGGYTGSWSLGLDYFRLDGSSSCDNRAAWCKTFNDPSNIRARLFLISTRAGGLGINLVAANRVIIFDVSWNPSHDIQSIYRVYRFGQTKPSYIYRFVTLGTMEMKIYERQVIKQAISKRVIDEQQIDRHYNQNDLAELYKFEPVPEGERPIPLVPKDILLGELLQTYENLIYKYHEHQSLLENKEDEVLDEAERKAAWEEFENEKKNRQFTANIRGMFGNSVQLPLPTIVTALTNIIRREHPTFTLLEIQGVIPQLLQELHNQMATGESPMYMKVVSEFERMQMEQQQAKIAEYYKLQQQQQALRLFQKYQGSGNLPQAQPEFSRYLQQMTQRQQPNFNQPSNSRRQANPSMDPNEVVSIDD